MASPELIAQLNDLKQQLSQLQSTPMPVAQEPVAQSPIDVSTTGKARLAAGAGGLLGIADMWTLGGAGQVVAGGNALIDALQGKSIREAYAERASQTAAMKDFYRQRAAEENAAILGLPVTELVAAVKGPMPGSAFINRATTGAANLAKTATGVGRTALVRAGLLAEKAPTVATEVIKQGPGLVSRLSSGALTGAGIGAAYPLVAVDVPEEKRGELAGVGAALGALLGAAGSSVAGAAKPAEELGAGLRRSARGVRKTDYTKTFNNSIIEEIPGNPGTVVKNTMDDLVKNKTLGKSIDPDQMYNNLQIKKADLEDQIQSVLQRVDDEAAQSGVRLVTVKDLQFPNAQKFIQKGNFDPRATDLYWNDIDTLKDAIIREGQGKVSVLNNIKRGIGEGWSDAKLADPAFSRAIYTDLKQVIEKYAPQVAPLNSAKRKLLIAEPIIGRGKRAAENVTLDAARTMFNTTGGSSVVGSLQAGKNIGAPGTAVATNVFLKAAATNRGKEIIGKTLQKLSVPAKTAEKVVGPTLAINRESLLRAEEQKQKAKPKIAKPKAKPLPIQIGKKKIANVTIPKGEQYADESLVRAMIEVESGGKPDAVSPKGAIGLMQIMPGTAKELGIDPKDPAQNVEGGSRYVKQMQKKFGDKKLAIAAYNMGQGALEKAINRAGTTSWPSIVKRLGIYSASNKKGVPEETVKYVEMITSRLGR